MVTGKHSYTTFRKSCTIKEPVKSIHGPAQTAESFAVTTLSAEKNRYQQAVLTGDKTAITFIIRGATYLQVVFNGDSKISKSIARYWLVD